MKLDKRPNGEMDDDRVDVYLCPRCGGINMSPAGPADGMLANYNCDDCGYDGKVAMLRTAIIHEDDSVDIV